MTETEKQLFADEVVLRTIKKLNEYYYLTPRDITSTITESEALVNLICVFVCEHEGIERRIVMSLSRDRQLAFTRQIIFYLSRKILHHNISLKKIGSILRPENPIDHATVLHGIRTVENLMDTDKKIHKKVTILYNKLLSVHAENLNKFIIPNGK